MMASRNKDSLVFQGHHYQIFQDLSQLILVKWKAMKLHLLILQQHCIQYHWYFPFAISLTYNGLSFQPKCAKELQTSLQELHLLLAETTAKGYRCRAAFSCRTKIPYSPGFQSTSNTNKRGRYISLGPAPNEDSMD